MADADASLGAAQWERLKEGFAELSGASVEARARGLAAFDDDPLVQAQLSGLLLAADRVGDRFERGASRTEALAPPAPALEGKRIGPWQIERLIGQGGMGSVYEAHRADTEYTRRVALKTLAAGRDSEAIVRRFRHERQILASLEHPNIATLLDGGMTPDGVPYFVMEYVEGEPLDRWCRLRGAGLVERLHLMGQVLAAIQYAHEHLIVHRDLKPSNLLVMADGTVKLLDFGIAKVLDATGSADPALTQTGVLPMTAGYASPEQRRGAAISTTSDVYSLGVVLYELLAGQRPYPDGASLEASDRPPPPPSRVVAEERMRRRLAGDLDSIVLKALRPEPEQRYRSAQLFADDIAAWLAGRPVSARADAWSYRAGKFLRRHSVAVVAGVVAVGALLGATLLSVQQARLARAERDRALREARRTGEVTAFLQDVLASAKPDRLGSGVTVVAALDSAIARSDAAFGDEPDLRAAVKLTLGSTLAHMYHYERARPLLEEALRLRRGLDGSTPSREQGEALFDLAGIEAEIGDAGRAESLYRTALDIRRAHPPVDSAALFEGISNFAESMLAQGKLTEAAALYDTVAQALDRLRPDDKELRAVTRANRGTALAQLGRTREAEPLLRESVRLFAEARGADDPGVASAMQPLAGALILNGRFVEAESVARRAVAINTREFGPDNPATLSALRMVTGALVESGRCAEAGPLLDRMLAARGHGMAETDPTLGVALMQRGQCQAAAGQLGASEATLRSALAVRVATFGASHWAVAQVQSLLGDVLGRRGADREAETLLRAGLDGLRRGLTAGHPRIAEAEARLASFLRARHRSA